MKLNIGCGRRNFGEDWVHIDGEDYDHLDSDDIFINHYSQCSTDLIYASHLIEYFDREEVVPLLSRWKDVLKPNGILRLAVPDFNSIVQIYYSGILDGVYSLDNCIGLLYGKMPMGDKTIYHRTVYDFESLKLILEKLGFKDVKRYDWRETEHSQFDDHSQAYFPRMDKENGLLMSLNVECKK
jgi:predicted SAM-dependent methyltransferase